jgi:hypothetical protein
VIFTPATSIQRIPWCRPRGVRPTTCCARVATPPDRPDLATYSQNEQISLGSAPSWNSPDITTNNEFPWTLLPQAQIVVRNLSATASAVNALVNVSTSAFGIGMPRTPLAGLLISLGPSQSVTLEYPFSPSILAGDQSIGTFVDILHPYDKRLINNKGAQTLKGVTTSNAGRGIDFQFPVANQEAAPRTIDLAIVTSTLIGSLSLTSHAFVAFEQIAVTLHIDVPATMHGTAGSPVYNEVTVVGTSGGALVDGLTHIVWVDD